MKIAFAGKGGAGKTSLTAWMGDYLARQGREVWLVDADTAVSLGQASGLGRAGLPEPLAGREDVVRERIGAGFMRLNPDVSDLPEALSTALPLGAGIVPGVRPGTKRLMVMGVVPGAGGGCACAANTLLKAVLAHLVLDRRECVLIDLEAGVEHLGRGTVAHVDALVVVSEPSLRSLETAAEVGRLAFDLGLTNQVLALNRCPGQPDLSDWLDRPGLPPLALIVPPLEGLRRRQLHSASVLDLPESDLIDTLCGTLDAALRGRTAAMPPAVNARGAGLSL